MAVILNAVKDLSFQSRASSLAAQNDKLIVILNAVKDLSLSAQ